MSQDALKLLVHTLLSSVRWMFAVRLFPAVNSYIASSTLAPTGWCGWDLSGRPLLSCHAGPPLGHRRSGDNFDITWVSHFLAFLIDIGLRKGVTDRFYSPLRILALLHRPSS